MGDGLFEVLAHGVEVCLHGVGVAAFDYGAEFLEAFADALELVGGVGVEEDFAQQVVVLAHQSVGYGQMPLECGAGCILMFHDASEHESGGKRYGERVGYGLVVLGEGVFLDMEIKPLVYVAEEYLAEMVTLGYDDGVFVAEIG